MKLDAYENELLELDESGKISLNPIDAIEKSTLMEAARETLQKDKRINIRMSGRDLLSLKRKANRFGIPYQTLISSILHQYVSGDLKPTQVEEAQSKYRRSLNKYLHPSLFTLLNSQFSIPSSIFTIYYSLL
jgi:predicted DNA binding CopG/RHH family protein